MSLHKMQEPVRIEQPKLATSEWEELKDTIWALLDEQEKMVLSYSNEMGEPTQSFMLYTVDDELNFFFGTLKRFPKYEFLIQNPPLSIFVEPKTGNGLMAITVKAVILEEISDREELEELILWFSSKNSCKYYIKDQEDFVIFKAKPLSIRLVDGNSDELIRYDLNL